MDNCQNRNNQNQQNPQRETICIDTKKIYDSCKDKDCLTDLRVYLSARGREVIDRAITVKIMDVELVHATIDVEPIQFNNGFYTVDIIYFYRVTADAFCGISRPTRVVGLAFAQKRTILFGSEGNAKIFSSQFVEKNYDVNFPERSNLPTAVLEIVEPIVLDSKLVDKIDLFCDCVEIPQCVCSCFDEDIDIFIETGKNLLVTLGQFSIVRLERDIQIMIPQCDICIPTKDCNFQGTSSDPCELFETLSFPTEQFFPPSKKHGHCNK